MENKVATVKNPSLLQKLIEIQRGEGLSDYAFANKLGIVRQLWQFTRIGKKEIRFTLLKAIVHTYPELTDYVINFLRDSHGQQ